MIPVVNNKIELTSRWFVVSIDIKIISILVQITITE